MGVDVKKINLEEFKIRFTKESESNWGNIAKDFSWDILFDISEKIPLEDVVINGEIQPYKRMRYRNMINLLNWANSFLKDLNVYQICKRKNDYILLLSKIEGNKIDYLIKSKESISDVFSGSIEMYKEWVVIDESGEINETDENGEYYQEGDDGVTCVYKITDGLKHEYIKETEINKSIGKQYLSSNEYANFFKIFINSSDDENVKIKNAIDRLKLFYDKANNDKKEIGTLNGYIDLPIYISEEVTDLGLFSKGVDFWVQNKHYHLNDIVLDENETAWRLVKCANDKESVLRESIVAPTVLNDFLDKQIADLDSYYEIFDEKNIKPDFYDIRDVSNPTIYLRKENSLYYYEKAYYFNSVFDKEYWEECKQIDNLKTQISGISESKLVSLKREQKTYDDDSNKLPFFISLDNNSVELEYKVNEPKHFLDIGENIYYDYISEIDIDENNKNITFIYFIGACQESGEKGIKYKETYPYEDKQYTCKYNGNIKTFNYKDINYKCQLDIEKYELEEDKLYSTFFIDENTVMSNDFQLIHNYIKNENLMGIQKIKEDIDIKIERGKSAAFEMHQVLGELSSFEDLISYKNGFLNVKES